LILGTTAAFLFLVVVALVLAWNYYSDPQREFEAIQREAHAGRRVILLHETGLPRWHQWLVGEDHAKMSNRRDLPFYLNTPGMVLLEVAPPLPAKGYRLRLRARHNSGANFSSVGLYFGRNSRVTPQGVEQCFCDFSFADQGARRGQVQLFLRRFLENEQGTIVNKEFQPVLPQPLNPPGPGPGEIESGPWRNLVVEVREDRLRLQCDESTFDVPRSRLARWAQNRFADAGGAAPRFAPEEGVGLYLYQASASFAMFIVEPLTD
jgi:hypothetical protein